MVKFISEGKWTLILLPFVFLACFMVGYALGGLLVPDVVNEMEPIKQAVGVSLDPDWLVNYFDVERWSEERAWADGYDDYINHWDQLVGAAGLCIENEAEIAYAVDKAADMHFAEGFEDRPVYIVALLLLYGKASEQGEDVFCLELLPEVVKEIESDK